MTGTRLAFALLLAMTIPSAATAGDGVGLFHRKPKIDPARVRQLAEVVRSDPDEKKRKAAVVDLAEADPRVHTEVIPTLIAALRKDTSASVRAGAAEVIGRLQVVFPLAGAALEGASEADTSLTVRDAAKAALWEYHMNGYRSAKGVDGIAGQTVEPPFAKPPRLRVPVTAEPPTASVVPVVATIPPPPAIDTLPLLGPSPGPRVNRLQGFWGVRTILLPTSYSNPTVEPPIARIPERLTFAPTVSSEPPILPRWPEPTKLGKPPPLALDLPPIVTPPDSR